MSEIKRIQEQLKSSFYGDAWHGPSFMDALKDVTAEQAVQHPIRNAHSIWELVLHMTTWITVVNNGVQGKYVDVPHEVDWPQIANQSETDWQKALVELKAANEKLEQTVQLLQDEVLENKVEKTDYTIYTLLHGIVQHNIYHAGQIVLLKKFK